ncbi:ribosomal protein S18 [Pyronema omphalodes]|nr:ribosomal protein S18 [Pyronema omphalodes]
MSAPRLFRATTRSFSTSRIAFEESASAAAAAPRTGGIRITRFLADSTGNPAGSNTTGRPASTGSFNGFRKVGGAGRFEGNVGGATTDANRDRARKVMEQLGPRLNAAAPAVQQAEEFTERELMSSQFRFMTGDIYAPNDLSMQELERRRGNQRPVRDAFDILGINPMTQYKNYNLLSEYVTSMGRIMHSRETGLRPVNQRRIARAIRRAVGIGFLPSTHRHPEVLRMSEANMNSKLSRAPRR